MGSVKTLILLAHGSRAPETVGEMQDLASRMRKSLLGNSNMGKSGAGLDIRGAYLSLSDPDLATACGEAVDAGAGEIHILPLFLFSGKHVLGDIPDQVETLKTRHPGVNVVLLDPIGRHPEFPDFLLKAASLFPE